MALELTQPLVKRSTRNIPGGKGGRCVRLTNSRPSCGERTHARTHTHRDNFASKGKVHPRTGHQGPEGEQRYSSTLSLTSALNGVGGERDALAALPPRKTRYPM
jgi:hypothetical protein